MNLSKRIEIYKKLSGKDNILKEYIDKEFTDIKRLSKMVHHTTKIEGSQVEESDVERIIGVELKGLNTPNETKTEGILEVIGMLTACNYVKEKFDSDVLTEEFIMKIYNKVYKLVARKDMGKYPGEYRHLVGHTRTREGLLKPYLNPDYVESYTQDLIDWYNDLENITLEDISEFKLRFIHIHPFSDGNGRTSRLLLNWMLIVNGYPPILIRYEDRDEYIDSLNEYGKFGTKDRFNKFIYSKLIISYEEILKDILLKEHKIRSF